jgi:hypothetical protein
MASTIDSRMLPPLHTRSGMVAAACTRTAARAAARNHLIATSRTQATAAAAAAAHTRKPSHARTLGGGTGGVPHRTYQRQSQGSYNPRPPTSA